MINGDGVGRNIRVGRYFCHNDCEGTQGEQKILRIAADSFFVAPPQSYLGCNSRNTLRLWSAEHKSEGVDSVLGTTQWVSGGANGNLTASLPALGNNRLEWGLQNNIINPFFFFLMPFLHEDVLRPPLIREPQLSSPRVKRQKL